MEEPPTYAPLYLSDDVFMNGKSYMDFTMEISAVSIKDGSPVGSKPLGTWKSGLSTELKLLDPSSMKNYTAEIVYRVVTVEV